MRFSTAIVVAMGAANSALADKKVTYTFDKNTGVEGTVEVDLAALEKAAEIEEYGFPAGSVLQGNVTVNHTLANEKIDEMGVSPALGDAGKMLFAAEAAEAVDCKTCLGLCVLACIFPPACAGCRKF